MSETIGLIIKEARIAQGISQDKLAKSLGLESAQSISNIERGVSPLPLKFIAQLSRTLKIDPDKIIECLVDEARLQIKKQVYTTQRSRRQI